MSTYLDQWVQREGVERWGVLKQHTQILETLLQNTISPQDAAKELVDIAALGSGPSDSAYRLWNLLYHVASSFPTYIDHIVQLTLAIYKVSSSSASPNTHSYSLWSHWQDTHSYYYTWRALKPSFLVTGAKYCTKSQVNAAFAEGFHPRGYLLDAIGWRD